MNKYLLITLCLLVSSCSTEPQVKPQQLDEWRVSTMAPKYYSAYIDILLITGEKKQGGWRGMVTKYTKFSKHPNSWEGRERYSSGYSIQSTELPGLLYIRWHSLANKKTYNKTIKVSEDIRNKMREYHDIRCGYYDLLLPYKNNILLGLAPDGMISVFLNGGCFDNELQFKVQAVEYKVADDFVYPELSEEAQAYVDEHGVPTGI
ncbi:DUF2931 family protein [Aliivibrio fischeri]|uniref:DUF2931 family protein n=1 Tax=Aliivibrio fischeri TaxID=668 RepID=UPI0007C58818|nr:DUF2931 family protein [Aliivibrio fischeri]MBP3139819.1 DUF2931 family protein [Aliivibrio fischeri]MBP3154201.1 DUF2931 family protein [Aliivibrio fischeri]MCE7571937.1 DUF2931 family protein [Aliivibrio fischeri]